ALVSFVWTPHNPERVDVPIQFLPPGSRGYLLGTDQLGRDVLSQLMVGARITLLVGIVTVALAMVAGVPLGGLAALYRPLEELVMRANDVLLAFPALLLAMLFAAAFRSSTLTSMIAIGIAFVPVFARVVRGAGLQVAAQDYVTASRAFGARGWWLFARHLLPNVLSLVIVQATVAFALAILAQAALSYLGLGTPPPTPTWGGMLSQSQTYFTQDAWLALWPGAAIALSVLGFNLLGDGLRDVLDPRLVERVAA
ncbi:MAG: ABC transporter permease, partial [Candidatus Dormibacteraeota bacterium]|nr:ABC transporter permease [Candidatus Dormibacteraeota bacterium]